MATHKVNLTWTEHRDGEYWNHWVVLLSFALINYKKINDLPPATLRTSGRVTTNTAVATEISSQFSWKEARDYWDSIWPLPQWFARPSPIGPCFDHLSIWMLVRVCAWMTACASPFARFVPPPPLAHCSCAPCPCYILYILLMINIFLECTVGSRWNSMCNIWIIVPGCSLYYSSLCLFVSVSLYLSTFAL